MGEQARRWKARRKIGSSKSQTAKAGAYLAVWDLREGWDRGSYANAKEHTLVDIAKQLRLPVSTAFAHYRAAFLMVVGTDFTPELWWRVMMPLKFSRLFGKSRDPAPPATKRRARSPLRREVPESVVGKPTGSSHAAGFVERLTTVTSEAGVRALILDLRAMFARGAGDEEVARRLGLPDAKTMPEIRRRLDEFESLAG